MKFSESKSGHDPKDYGIPTPIDPADIRPGDVVRQVDEFTVTGIGVEQSETYLTGTEGRWVLQRKHGRTWHLVHRPDPDAEAVEALLAETRAEERAHIVTALGEET